ncbi:hypothetical protein IQ06DRAFT_61135 [Phaeosphaeriaceae sp. SRC1lsM3a]|nr:hypothetical protein IQ06DRAFT_61135 [Stagonospora sp. SRC1lsM3a]
MHTTMRSLALGLALLISGTSAQVSLSSFTPRVDIQNSVQCRAAYTTTIKGCQASDFTPPNRCSSACVQGLQDIGEVIKRVCKDVDVGETSIIGVFQFGIGIASLCPGVDVVTASSSAARTTARTTNTQAATSRTTTTSSVPPPVYSLDRTSLSLTTSTTTSTLAVSSQAAQSTSSQGELQVDPSPTSVAGGAPTGDAQPPATSAAARPNAQAQNDVSGGGSPFDVAAFGTSSRLRALDCTLAALVGTALFFVACA